MRTVQAVIRMKASVLMKTAINMSQKHGIPKDRMELMISVQEDRKILMELQPFILTAVPEIQKPIPLRPVYSMATV